MSAAWPCAVGSVRDAAFQGERNVHRLCVIANADDAQAASTEFAALQKNCETASERLTAIRTAEEEALAFKVPEELLQPLVTGPLAAAAEALKRA